MSRADLLISMHAGPTRALLALAVRRSRARTMAARILLDRLTVDVRATMERS
jgi:hypothetical protein